MMVIPCFAKRAARSQSIPVDLVTHAGAGLERIVVFEGDRHGSDCDCGGNDNIIIVDYNFFECSKIALSDDFVILEDKGPLKYR